METRPLARIRAWMIARRTRLAAAFFDASDFGLMACHGCTLNCQQGRACPSRQPAVRTAFRAPLRD